MLLECLCIFARTLVLGVPKHQTTKKQLHLLCHLLKMLQKKKKKSLTILLFFILFFSLLLDLSLLTLSNLFLLSDWVVVVRSVGSNPVMACCGSGGLLWQRIGLIGLWTLWWWVVDWAGWFRFDCGCCCGHELVCGGGSLTRLWCLGRWVVGVMLLDCEGGAGFFSCIFFFFFLLQQELFQVILVYCMLEQKNGRSYCSVYC